MSLSTEDGQSVELCAEDVDASPPAVIHPQLLPPIPFPSESFSESLESITGGQRALQPSRTQSIASRRMSYMTELRSKRDRSDTASLMTVDEITAEVESRRSSTVPDRGSDQEEWTKVENEDGIESDTPSSPVPDEEEEEEEDEEDEEEEVDEESTLNVEDDDEPGKPITSKGGKYPFPRNPVVYVVLTSPAATKWIKGALIGAGSFGKVYLGMDASNGLLMAVKQVELPSGSAPNPERKKAMLSALEREIELLQDLQHENIVQYLCLSLP